MSTPTPSGPAHRSIPAVVAAVRAAQRGSPIPSELTPPLEDLVLDRYPRIPDCWGLREDPEGVAKCTLFADGATRTIVLIGDSHARSWLPAISWMAQRDGWAVVPVWHGGCWPAAYHAGGECEDVIRWVQQQVRELRPDVVLIGGAFRFQNEDSIPRTVNGISTLVPELRPYARHVMVIGDPPSLVFQPVRCLSADGATLASCTRTLSADQVSAYEAARGAATEAGASFLDTMGWFCFQRQCPAVVGHTVAYRVSDHISRTYASGLARLFRAAFMRAM